MAAGKAGRDRSRIDRVMCLMRNGGGLFGSDDAVLWEQARRPSTVSPHSAPLQKNMLLLQGREEQNQIGAHSNKNDDRNGTNA